MKKTKGQYSIDRGIGIIITIILGVVALMIIGELGYTQPSFLHKLANLNTSSTIVQTFGSTIIPILFFVGVAIAIIYALIKKYS